jgi:hypothetical protein
LSREALGAAEPEERTVNLRVFHSQPPVCYRRASVGTLSHALVFFKPVFKTVRDAVRFSNNALRHQTNNSLFSNIGTLIYQYSIADIFHRLH